jgi:toxin ParE1/3/4
MAADHRSYRLSLRAEQDLEEIWAYTFCTWSREQADQYHADIIAAIEGLARGERNGRSVHDIRAGYLKYAVGLHFLFYRLTADHLDVVRILHQRMDVSAHLGNAEITGIM